MLIYTVAFQPLDTWSSHTVGYIPGLDQSFVCKRESVGIFLLFEDASKYLLDIPINLVWIIRIQNKNPNK